MLLPLEMVRAKVHLSPENRKPGCNITTGFFVFHNLLMSAKLLNNPVEQQGNSLTAYEDELEELLFEQAPVQ